MNQFKRIMFVGKDNTLRSVMAQGIMEGLLADEPIEVVSKGTIVLFPEPLNQKMELVLHAHGLHPKDGNTEALVKEDLTEDTLVLTISFQDKLKVIEDFDYSENVYTLMEFAGKEEELRDPYGEDVCEYELCFQEMSQVLGQIAHKLGFSNGGIV